MIRFTHTLDLRELEFRLLKIEERLKELETFMRKEESKYWIADINGPKEQQRKINSAEEVARRIQSQQQEDGHPQIEE